MSTTAEISKGFSKKVTGDFLEINEETERIYGFETGQVHKVSSIIIDSLLRHNGIAEDNETVNLSEVKILEILGTYVKISLIDTTGKAVYKSVTVEAATFNSYKTQ
jgi:hypothetical protein